MPELSLADFLLERIAEDESYARRVPDGRGGAVGGTSLECSAHYWRWHPARVLAECEAKRRIIERYQELIKVDHFDDPDVHLIDEAYEYEDRILPLLAQPYADHPDYQAGVWRSA
jgi:hypothetical protein